MFSSTSERTISAAPGRPGSTKAPLPTTTGLAYASGLTGTSRLVGEPLGGRMVDTFGYESTIPYAGGRGGSVPLVTTGFVGETLGGRMVESTIPYTPRGCVPLNTSGYDRFSYGGALPSVGESLGSLIENTVSSMFGSGYETTVPLRSTTGFIGETWGGRTADTFSPTISGRVTSGLAPSIMEPTRVLEPTYASGFTGTSRLIGEPLGGRGVDTFGYESNIPYVAGRRGRVPLVTTGYDTFGCESTIPYAGGRRGSVPLVTSGFVGEPLGGRMVDTFGYESTIPYAAGRRGSVPLVTTGYDTFGYESIGTTLPLRASTEFVSETFGGRMVDTFSPTIGGRVSSGLAPSIEPTRVLEPTYASGFTGTSRLVGEPLGGRMVETFGYESTIPDAAERRGSVPLATTGYDTFGYESTIPYAGGRRGSVPLVTSGFVGETFGGRMVDTFGYESTIPYAGRRGIVPLDTTGYDTFGYESNVPYALGRNCSVSSVTTGFVGESLGGRMGNTFVSNERRITAEPGRPGSTKAPLPATAPYAAGRRSSFTLI